MALAFQQKGFDIALIPLSVDLEVLADMMVNYQHEYGYTQKVKLEY